MTAPEATVTAHAPPGGSVTATATEPAKETKVIEHGEASRMPDTSWTWRRALIFGICALASVLLYIAVAALIRIVDRAVVGGQITLLDRELFSALKLVIKYAFYTLWLGLILYGVGATVTDLAKLAAAVKTTRRETHTSGPATAPRSLPATPEPPPPTTEDTGNARPI